VRIGGRWRGALCPVGSGSEHRRAERQAVSRAGGPRGPNAARTDRRSERSTYEGRVYDDTQDFDGEKGVVWVPFAGFRPFGR
jgi:hypothetical protein